MIYVLLFYMEEIIDYIWLRFEQGLDIINDV